MDIMKSKTKQTGYYCWLLKFKSNYVKKFGRDYPYWREEFVPDIPRQFSTRESARGYKERMRLYYTKPIRVYMRIYEPPP